MLEYLAVTVDPPAESGVIAFAADNPKVLGTIFWLIIIMILWSRPVIRYGLIGAAAFALLMIVMNGGGK